MAVDEAMLLAHARGFAPPTLRFYGWNPECLSLGRLQKQLPDAVREKERAEISNTGISNGKVKGVDRNEDDEKETAADFDVVRRPTGGRAVWHAQEITYCAVVRAELLPPEARSVEGAYRWLSEGFLRGLQLLGLPVALAPGGVKANGPNCFAVSASCDFVANGKKLIGAAQCRAEDAILQHGSLLLSIDENRWRNLAGGPMDSAISLRELGNFSRDAVVEALCAGFAATANVRWQPDGLGTRESELAQLLWERKYVRPEWTFGAKVAAEALQKIEAMLQV
ncbi:lipoate-protein ligase A [Abditibacterium utsteinense]|uniref:Lipoate-protein ligase A n=2 Tax=Abditibacterium utsteinense TaxID=1960156 RepID=A0A2S8SQW5_9BACT|nr:lipoate-protein ligase A [Abditibacterium utsteinense]